MTKDEFLDELDEFIAKVEDMGLTEETVDEYVEELAEFSPELADAVEDAFLGLLEAARIAEELKEDDA